MRVKGAPRPLTLPMRLGFSAVIVLMTFLLVFVPLCRLSSDLLVQDYPVLKLNVISPSARYWASRAEHETAVKFYAGGAGFISLLLASLFLYSTHPLRVRPPAAKQKSNDSAKLAKLLNDECD